jgi:selenocysteine lyase/cysteine desulfurase
VQAIGCDFLACSAYKFYGPHVGLLWGRRELVDALEVPRLDPAPNETAERLETGTQNHEGIVGAAAAVDFLASLGAGNGRRARLTDAFSKLHVQAHRQVTRLWDALGAMPRLRRFGLPPNRPRTPTVGFAIDGMSPAEAAVRLADDALFLSHGDFYALTVIERLGRAPDGLLRAGCACYTSDEDVERLIDAVARL